jgi:hypothetical protein
VVVAGAVVVVSGGALEEGDDVLGFLSFEQAMSASANNTIACLRIARW